MRSPVPEGVHRPQSVRAPGVLGLVVVLVVVLALVLAPEHRLPGGVGTAVAAPVQGGPEQLPAPEPDPDDVRAEADRILGGDEFGGDAEAPGGGQGGSAGGDADPIEIEGPQVPQPAPFGGLGAVGTAVMWLLVVALVAAAVWVLARAWTRRRRRRGDDVDDVDDDVVVVDDLLRDDEGRRRPAEGWLALAEEAEAAGRWREGLRCRYAALAVVLVERRVLDDVPGRTTGEHRADVAEVAPAVAGDFVEVAELFDRAWYGDLPTGPDESARVVAAAGRVLSGTDPDRAPAAGVAT